MNSVQCAHCGQWFVAGTQGVPIHGCFPDGATMKTMVDGREFAKLAEKNQRLLEALNYASRDLDPEDIIEIQAILYGEQGENDE